MTKFGSNILKIVKNSNNKIINILQQNRKINMRNVQDNGQDLKKRR